MAAGPIAERNQGKYSGNFSIFLNQFPMWNVTNVISIHFGNSFLVETKYVDRNV